MTLVAAPLWIQVALVAEALAVVWLTARFGWRGLAAGVAAAAAFWLLFGLGASWLVSRLEGGGAAADPVQLASGAALGAARLAVVAAPLVALAALLGLALRRLSPRKH